MIVYVCLPSKTTCGLFESRPSKYAPKFNGSAINNSNSSLSVDGWFLVTVILYVGPTSPFSAVTKNSNRLSPITNNTGFLTKVITAFKSFRLTSMLS